MQMYAAFKVKSTDGNQQKKEMCACLAVWYWQFRVPGHVLAPRAFHKQPYLWLIKEFCGINYAT